MVLEREIAIPELRGCPGCPAFAGDQGGRAESRLPGCSRAAFLSSLPSRNIIIDAMTSPSLDIEEPAAFLPYLKAAGLVENGESVATTVLPGGVSSRTVLVDW